ncbi:hypothetical protein C8J56DRAFT_1039447 [Mycena floridula]|nr:hypothetical protein C8J56DRAFT_1039447 [Mycena floridula]
MTLVASFISGHRHFARYHRLRLDALTTLVMLFVVASSGGTVENEIGALTYAQNTTLFIFGLHDESDYLWRPVCCLFVSVADFVSFGDVPLW